MKVDKIQKLYDYITLLSYEQNNKVGFELSDGQKSEEVEFELVTPPTPQIKKLSDKEKTLEEEGIVRSTLLNIKQLA